MIQIDVSLNKGFNWQQQGKIFVKGFFFDKHNNFYKDKNLVEFFSDVSEESSFKQKLFEANGFFSVIIEKNNNLFAAVDRLRSIPLFYGQKDGNFYISDNASWVRNQLNESEIDKLSEMEFLRTGYVIGENTLSRSVKQLQAGEYLFFKAKQKKLRRYYLHTHGNFLKLSEKEHFDNLDAISKSVLERLIKSTGGKTLVIPLSSGFDSRYIVALLKKMQHKDVICYTYGRPESFEVDISAKVSQLLGYPWYFIEYTREKWKDYFKSKRVAEYNRFSNNLTSLPHIQEYIAVKELKERSLIPPDSVFVPGFCGDLLGGSYVPNEYKNKPEKLMSEGIVEYIFKHHFNLDNPLSKSGIELIKNHIKETLKHFPTIKNIDDFVSINEAWFTNHKVAKFIINSLRIYEFFGFEWRMPLWDNELIDYWYRIPHSFRINDKLYDRYLLHRIFKTNKIDFVKKDSVTRTIYLKVLKKLIPLKCLNILRKIYASITKRKAEIDYNAFNELSAYYYKDLKEEQGIKMTDDVNQIFSKWFILKMKK